MVDANGDSSPTATVTINVGFLDLGTVSQNSSFVDTKLNGQSQLIKRSDNWKLNINDTRGAGSAWTLSAAVTPFIGQNIPDNTLKGNWVYVDGLGNETVRQQPLKRVRMMVPVRQPTLWRGGTAIRGYCCEPIVMRFRIIILVELIGR